MLGGFDGGAELVDFASDLAGKLLGRHFSVQERDERGVLHGVTIADEFDGRLGWLPD
jgi:hypothetical protein